MTVAGKAGIVTGAGSGLGEAAAKRLAREGANVVVADVNADAAERVVKEIEADGGTAAPFTIDVQEYDQAKALVSMTIDTFGGLNFALNNAGITPPLLDLHEIDPADWTRVININLVGIFNCMKAELEHFVTAGGGVILNMASTAGVMAHAQRSAYSASKHGIVGLTRTAAVEYAQRNIRINAVAPGPIDAPSAQGLPPNIREWLESKTAMHRLGTPEEVACVAHFLLSDEASFVTGSVYEINGGQTQL